MRKGEIAILEHSIITEGNVNTTVGNTDNDDAWWAILYFLLHISACERVSALWSDFENEIRYKNRFFPKSKILEQLATVREQAELTIKRGEVYYRARILDSMFIGKNKEEIIGIIVKNRPEMKGKDFKEIHNYIKAMHALPLVDEKLQNDIDAFLKKRKRFWGYDKNNSDAPPCNLATEGRANPRYISYLYISSDIKTAIYEVRPNVGQNVSMAKIRIDKDLQIYDLCSMNIAGNAENAVILQKISELFSDTKQRDNDDYYATQYICEYIKSMGYDGIRFKSSLNPVGYNVVLFDTQIHSGTKKKNYTILNSKVYSVSDIDIQYRRIAPK